MSRHKLALASRVRKAIVIVLVLPLLVLLLPLVAVFLLFRWLRRVLVSTLVWTFWMPKGKDVLFVNSDSPIWHDYMKTDVLPLVEKRAVVLNWSERKRWSRWALSYHAFHSFAGGAEFNPLVIVFRPWRPALVLRFWPAFKDWKRGYKEPVERLRQELIARLELQAGRRFEI